MLIKDSRLKRNKIANWQSVSSANPDLVQIITDVMAIQEQIQIEYQDSGWRLISPYGWNSSKAGDVLLMCYKDTGEVRSYRLDRINQVLVDDSIFNQTDMLDNDFNMQDNGKARFNPEDFEIPLLPNIDEILYKSENEIGEELPYDTALDTLNGEDQQENYEEDVNILDGK